MTTSASQTRRPAGGSRFSGFPGRSAASGAFSICAISPHPCLGKVGSRWQQCTSGAGRIWSVLRALLIHPSLPSPGHQSLKTTMPTPAKSRHQVRSERSEECPSKAASAWPVSCQPSTGFGSGGAFTAPSPIGSPGLARNERFSWPKNRLECGFLATSIPASGGSSSNRAPSQSPIKSRTGTFSPSSASETRIPSWVSSVLGGLRQIGATRTSKAVISAQGTDAPAGTSPCTPASVTKPRLSRSAGGGASSIVVHSWLDSDFRTLAKLWRENASGGLGCIDAARAARSGMPEASPGFSAKAGKNGCANG